MPLQIFLAATLRRFIENYDPEKGINLSVEPGTTVIRIAEIIGIPEEEIKIIMVDGVHASPEYTLNGNERIAFFPAVGGG